MTPATDAHTQQPTLAGRRAAITGGTTGIGRAIAVLLASEGAEVFLCGRNEDHLADALARIEEVGKGGGIAIDLAEADNVGRFFAAAEEKMGGVDIAIINAAVAAEGITDTDEATLREVIAINFAGYLLSAHHAAKRVGDEGDIVFIGSTSAYALGPGSTIYAGIKYGIQGFTQALRRELGPKGIRVSNVEPGLTGSDMQLPDIQPDEQRERIADETMLRAEDIAVGVHYLLTQPRRAIVQQLTIVPRDQAEE
jgi:NAD(P)-dependent dehydrogenase (short-subunit alcohol dehydrogenase family)